MAHEGDSLNLPSAPITASASRWRSATLRAAPALAGQHLGGTEEFASCSSVVGACEECAGLRCGGQLVTVAPEESTDHQPRRELSRWVAGGRCPQSALFRRLQETPADTTGTSRMASATQKTLPAQDPALGTPGPAGSCMYEKT